MPDLDLPKIDFTLITSKEDELSALWTRMDGDRDLYYLAPYTLKDNLNRRISGIISVTLNMPATFAAHVQSALMSATQQVEVEGDDLEDEDTTKIEEFINALVEEGDKRLREKNEPVLRPFITEQLNIRGRAAARVTLRRKVTGGPVLVDIIPVDTRWFVYEMGEDDDGKPVMIWGAAKTWRWPADVNSEYGTKLSTSGTTRLVAVTDYWDKAQNVVFISEEQSSQPSRTTTGKPIFTQVNPYGYPPFVFQSVPLGSMLRDRDALSHYGESIFFLIRNLIPELNRLASIMQTQNQASVLPALQYRSSEGAQGTPAEGVGEIGTTTAVETDGGYDIIPTGDLKQAGKLLHDMITRMMQSGSLSDVELGNANFPLSAVAIIELGESSGQVFLPRLGAKGLLFQRIAEMMLDQLKNVLRVTSLKLGAKGHQKTYKVSDLAGEYSITYKYFVESPATDAARFAIAEAAKVAGIDQDTILRGIMHLEDPMAVRAARRSDDAELAVPDLLLYRYATSLIEQGKPIEAEIVAQQLGLTVEELEAGDVAPKPPKPQPARNLGTPVLPGTRADSNLRASELQGQPRETAEGE